MFSAMLMSSDNSRRVQQKPELLHNKQKLCTASIKTVVVKTLSFRTSVRQAQLALWNSASAGYQYIFSPVASEVNSNAATNS